MSMSGIDNHDGGEREHDHHAKDREKSERETVLKSSVGPRRKPQIGEEGEEQNGEENPHTLIGSHPIPR